MVYGLLGYKFFWKICKTLWPPSYIHNVRSLIAMFYFCHLKNPSDVMKNIFDSIYIYFWKKIKNIRNKRVIRKINLYFFDVMKNGHIFPSKVYHFQYDHRFFFSRKIGNIRTYKEVLLQMKNHFESAFPSDFLQNVLIETLNISHFVLCSICEKRWYLSGEKKNRRKTKQCCHNDICRCKRDSFLVKLKLQK